MAVRYDARTHLVHTRGRPLPFRTWSPRTVAAPCARWTSPGGLLLAAAAGLALLSVTEAGTAGLASPTVWMGTILAILAAVAFTWHIRTAREPFVAPSLFASSTFLAAIFVGFLARVRQHRKSLSGSPSARRLQRLSRPRRRALALAPGAVAVAILSPLAGRLSDRYGPWTVLPLGLTMMLGGVFMLSSFVAGASAYLWSPEESCFSASGTRG